ncbi:hydrolase 1, exosortase A system-associated [Paucibacter sp. B2R-40]|uniref:hydrolase 1, exosortase A system-associated n=1 Tax=Paucibacter sp. B2R-40 TaxID=2893554 RepID=UPI0021E39711|nr:hydrolase 1, exosortase A system-associated [Paucibacter sp. B2R-40]MCV2355506.1 hydrolase 1, exosortase A system-associated [Paucibacter sp. B2R-40]
MNATCSETVLNFHCQGEDLLGIVSAPRAGLPVSGTGVIIVVGGPQYRVGSHRQFVQLARALASAGFANLRFDYRGMGDSGGAGQDFLKATADIKAAIDALLDAHPSLQHVVLWGLCDAASAALLYCDETQDQRVRGLVLLNPWVRSEESLARTQIKHYYLQRLQQAEFWRKLFSGQVALSALASLSASMRLASRRSSHQHSSQLSYQDKMARACAVDTRPVLLILSGNDYTAKEFVEVSQNSAAWRGFSEAAHIERQDMEHADHTFSDSASKNKLTQLTQSWLHTFNRHA